MKSNLIFIVPFIVFVIVGFKTNIVNQNQGIDLKASIKRGAVLYQSNCIACHMPEGQGIPYVSPPLENSKNLKNKVYITTIVKNGITVPTKVKGITYSTPMLGIDLNDKEISDVLNYIRNSWGNSFGVITPSEVKELLKSVKKE